MGYVSAIKPFSTLLAEKKCTTKGSNKEHTNTRIFYRTYGRFLERGLIL